MIDVQEHFFCPNRSLPILIRKPKVRNLRDKVLKGQIQTGVQKDIISQEFTLVSGEEKEVKVP